MKKRYYYNTIGNDYESKRAGLKFLCNYVIENPNNEYEIIILISQKAQYQFIEKIWSVEFAKTALKGYYSEKCGAFINILTEREFLSYDVSNPKKMIVYAVNGDIDKMELAEDKHSVEVICTMPWVKDSLNDWIKSLKIVELNGNSEIEPFEEFDDIVQYALHSLTSYVNLGNEYVDMSYQNEVKTYILALHQYYPILNAEQIKWYLVDSGWKSKMANQVRDWFVMKQERRSFKGGDKHRIEEMYDYWKRFYNK